MTCSNSNIMRGHPATVGAVAVAAVGRAHACAQWGSACAGPRLHQRVGAFRHGQAESGIIQEGSATATPAHRSHLPAPAGNAIIATSSGLEACKATSRPTLTLKSSGTGLASDWDLGGAVLEMAYTSGAGQRQGLRGYPQGKPHCYDSAWLSAHQDTLKPPRAHQLYQPGMASCQLPDSLLPVLAPAQGAPTPSSPRPGATASPRCLAAPSPFPAGMQQRGASGGQAQQQALRSRSCPMPSKAQARSAWRQVAWMHQELQTDHHLNTTGQRLACTRRAGSLHSHRLARPRPCPAMQHLAVREQRLVEVEADTGHRHKLWSRHRQHHQGILEVRPATALGFCRSCGRSCDDAQGAASGGLETAQLSPCVGCQPV